MDCPGCREILITVEHERVEVDVCPACRGVWLDAGELELILGKCGCEEPAWTRRGHQVAGDPPPDARICPVCGKRMLRGAFAPPSGATLDKCPDGDGLWFDEGELKDVLGESAAGDSQARAVRAFLSGISGGGCNTGGGD